MAMVKAPFNGQLNSNEIFSGIYNMIISQLVFADNVSDPDGLASKFKIDGSMYGDTRLYYATDALRSNTWGGDSEAANLLSLDRPDGPKCQAVTIDTYRQIRLTLDDYLSKKSWSDEGSFGAFTSVMMSWITATKDIYEFTYVNTYVGTNKGAANKATISVDATTALSGLSGVEKDQKEGMILAQAVADLVTEMTKDYSRDFNDYKFIRKYSRDDLLVIWNEQFVNKITAVSLPTIFHNENLKPFVGKDMLPKRYFGTVITSSNVSSYSAATPTTGKPIDSDDDTYVPGANNANGTIRSLIETPEGFKVGGVDYHLFPGDEIPSGATIKSGGDFELGEVYIEDNTIIAKVLHKNSIPFMSAFEVATEFWNPRSLTRNHYLTWGYSALDYLKNYPFLEIKEV